MVIVQLHEVSKSYGAREVLHAVDIEIQRGDRLAVVGENGAGKSTLFRLLAGIESPDQGTVSRAADAKIGTMEQELSRDGTRTVLDELLDASPRHAELRRALASCEEKLASPDLHNDAAQTEALLERYGRLLTEAESIGLDQTESESRRVLSGLGVPLELLDSSLDEISGGEKKLIALARLIVSKPDLLLLDEPDNHLDMKGKTWLEEYIRQTKSAIAVISHDRYFLDHVIDHVVEVEDGALYVYHCNYSGFRAEKQQRLERQAKEHEFRTRRLEELKKSAERLTYWASLNDKFAGRARNRRRTLAAEREKLDNTPKPVLIRKSVDLEFDRPVRSGKDALIIERLEKDYGERHVFGPLDLIVRSGERIGLVGPNGSGKSTLLKVLLGNEPTTRGSFRFGANVNVGYYAQEQESLDWNETPLDLVRRVQPMIESRAVAMLRGNLLLTHSECYTPIGRLSGGQKSRLQLAVLTLSGVNFLLLDEPTNNIDIPSMIALEDALMDFEGTILVASHDRYFLDEIVDRLLVFDKGAVELFPGNFTEVYERSGRSLNIGSIGRDVRRSIA
jgi:ATP-binding cassette subfamily F protein 3